MEDEAIVEHIEGLKPGKELLIIAQVDFHR